jgi:hypothetical protein
MRIFLFLTITSPTHLPTMLYLMGTPIYLPWFMELKDELNPINTKRDSMLLQTHAGTAKLV